MMRRDALPKSRKAQERYDAGKRRGQPARAELLTGYLHDSDRHGAARELLGAEHRAEIARMGGQARALALGRARALGFADAMGWPPPAADVIDAAPRARLKRAQRAAIPTAAPPAPMPSVWDWPPGGHPPRTPAQVKAAAAARAAASRPARRARKRAELAAITKALRS